MLTASQQHDAQPTGLLAACKPTPGFPCCLCAPQAGGLPRGLLLLAQRQHGRHGLTRCRSGRAAPSSCRQSTQQTASEWRMRSRTTNKAAQRQGRAGSGGSCIRAVAGPSKTPIQQPLGNSLQLQQLGAVLLNNAGRTLGSLMLFPAHSTTRWTDRESPLLHACCCCAPVLFRCCCPAGRLLRLSRLLLSASSPSRPSRCPTSMTCQRCPRTCTR